MELLTKIYNEKGTAYYDQLINIRIFCRLQMKTAGFFPKT